MALSIRRIGVLTSGGDAPGMNAAIRAVTRKAIVQGWEVFGIQDGYLGLIEDRFKPLGPRDVGGIIGRGGTVLGSARCKEFHTEEGRRQALHNLENHSVDALVVIGGNGSQTGANALYEMGYPVVGVASTIDNDLYGSEITIGVDTALDVALNAIDMLMVTASSHHRAFLVEVMGRDCGYLALRCAIAGGADAVTIPEVDTTPEEIIGKLQAAYDRGKSHALAVVAEGAKWNADRLTAYCRDQSDVHFELRATVLGHIQRGGTPGAYDRYLASRFGAAAVDTLAAGTTGVLVGLINNEISTTPYREVMTGVKDLDLSLLQLAEDLAR